MKSYLQWLAYAALISLLFIAVPLSYSRSKSKEEMKLQFDDYIEKFNKTYRNDPAEYETRFKHFMVSLDEIDKLNSLSRGPEQHKARYGLTRLSDMSQTEYKDLHLSDEKLTKAPEVYGRSWEEINVQGSKHHQSVITRKKRATLPLQVDWRLKGVVGGVQSQGMCGACWAFSTVGVIEAMAAISTGKLVPLSVQEVIDCAGRGNSGCAGGDICLLLDWLVTTAAPLETSKEYPLKLTNGTCKLPKTAAGVRVASFTCNNFVNAEDKILQALATHGPVAVAVNALTWQNYLGGVIQYHCSGLPTDLNHAVELVGYDLTSEVPYYIAKNSWGDDFGLGGYLKLAVGSNICGLGNEVATVDVK